jgi:hypothetical protein
MGGGVGVGGATVGVTGTVGVNGRVGVVSRVGVKDVGTVMTVTVAVWTDVACNWGENGCRRGLRLNSSASMEKCPPSQK